MLFRLTRSLVIIELADLSIEMDCFPSVLVQLKN